LDVSSPETATEDPRGVRAGTEIVPFRDAVRVWLRVAALSFGGPAGQIAVMHRILVEEKRWIGETRFLHALNYCMLLPGPEAHELAIYIGWLLNRTKGGLVAGVLFVLPGLIALSALSTIYALYGQIGIVGALFFGLKAAVLAVVLEAVMRVGKRALKNRAQVAIAATAFVGIFAFAIPFPLIIAAAAAAGLVGTAANLEWFRSGGHEGAKAEAGPAALIDAAFARGVPSHVRPSASRFVVVAVAGAVVWLGPLAGLALVFGTDSVFVRVGAFHAKMAVVTFGGAYAVLAYMAQQAVQFYHWLKPGEMLVGLGFAETTPGPLISVVQFVGFIAAFRAHGSLDPVVAGLLGGFIAMWATFVPPFLWIFLGGPYIEALIGNRPLNAALSAITAAVVGVILNLAVWFAIHVIFERTNEIDVAGLHLTAPVLASVSLPALVLATAAIVAIFRFRVGMIPVFAACSLAGALWFAVVGSI
jgi:chromate transporter